MAVVSPVQQVRVNDRWFRWRGAVAAATVGPAAVVAVLSSPVVPQDSVWHAAMQMAAWMCFVSGAALRFWATLYVGGRKEACLVTSGPYSICRNPLYLGSFLIAIAFSLFLESPVLALATALCLYIYQRTTIQVEEAVLRRRHGAAFDAYVRMVPRFWPSTLSLETPDALTVHVGSLWTECVRASRWIWVPVLGDLVMRLRAHVWWPAIFRGF